jgi:hypothetical protein
MSDYKSIFIYSSSKLFEFRLGRKGGVNYRFSIVYLQIFPIQGWYIISLTPYNDPNLCLASLLSRPDNKLIIYDDS